ncbi:serine/threonine-protein phosphatase 6 regulatory ankyrin repeat subunit B-like [Haliotis rubra]|uniref:serine/threonine-protein phosphatase 6 regulatory ankyrin repeat subunit B-like n=1 Tax=Haliotis rubra TaxID=36100 RepID=UPI001EE59F50|nr:serine/threonine-protein phosphatase 6 regulatory ankyrin repeat subunit B-like [Haliotis rubra]XP_046550947.1 serine/threonine-protein phosphatase 6 regulatory ankyrin repeat subunit B-like [Haliotis rubra]
MLRKHIIEGCTIQNTPASHQYEKKSNDSVSMRETGHVIEVIDEPDTDSVPVPPVKVACDCGHGDVASLLIAYSAGWLSDMDDSHLYDGESPLQLAYDAGFVDVVACLLSSATNSNAVDSNGYTIFQKACEHGDVKTLQNILKFHVEIKQQLFINSKDGEMLCHIASRRGHLHILQMLLEGGMDLDHLTDEGDNVLHLACSYDKYKVCTFLLDTIPNLAWIKNRNGFTPLDIALRRGNHKIVRMFFAHAKLTQYGRMQNTIWMYLCKTMDNINRLNVLVRCSNVMEMTDDHGNTPFHIAAKTGSTHAIDFLLKHDRKDCVTLKNSDGDTPLHVASHRGHSATVRSLLNQSHVNDQNNYNETALHLSSLNTHLDAIVALLTGGASVDSRNFQADSPLHLLFYGLTNKPDVNIAHVVTIIRHYLVSGADPCQNNFGNTPLHVACCTGKPVIVGELLPWYKDLTIRNTYGKTPLHVACERGHGCIVDLLLEVMWLRKLFGEEFDDFINHQDTVNGSTPLHLASRFCSQAVTALIEHGANTSIKDYKGSTPIFVAYLTGKIQIVKHLLPHTHSLDVNESGDTLLHAVYRSEQAEMFQVIIDWLGSIEPRTACNAVNASNSEKQTPLHLSSANGNSYFVEQLLLKGAMPNNPDKRRQTSLHYACTGRCLMVVSHLLKHEAHVNVCDDSNRTPLHYACETERLDIAEELVKAGGDPHIRDIDGRTPLDMCSTEHRATLMKSFRYVRKRQSTCSEDSPYSSKRAKRDPSNGRGCTFEDAQTFLRPRSVPQLRRSQSMGETRCVSSDDQ